jgi:DNA-binding CsgD family transcriptional regulator
MGTRGRPRHPDVLTPRQQEVLEYVRQGMTNEQIARQIGISPDGVKFHVSEILSRTGARRRREAAEWSSEREQQRPTAMLHTWRSGRNGRYRMCDRWGARVAVRMQERVAC